MYVRKECKKLNKIWNGKWSTDLGWPCIFVQQSVYAIRSRCLLFGLAKLAKVIVTQATDEWTTLYDRLWSFHCSSTDTILLSIYTTPQLYPGAWVGEYGRLGVLRYKFLPKQSRLFDDEAESSECREGGGETLLSVTQAIRACETCSPPSTPPTHTHKSLVQHCHFSPKGYFWKVSLLIRCLKIIGVW